jgi:hypothetical protein
MRDTTQYPASYLRSEIAAYDAGLRPNWEPWQREHYAEVAQADVTRRLTRASNVAGPKPGDRP